jgi:hypothetical protein
LDDLDDSIAAFLKEDMNSKNMANFNKLIEDYWNDIEKYLDQTIESFNRVVVYQDSFPIMRPALIPVYFSLILNDCPSSPHYRYIKKLLDKGAVLEGTESPKLLHAFESIQREAIKDPLNYDFYFEFLCNIAARRDRFVAQRIITTLPDGGAGILFMGLNHDVAGQLNKISKDIRIIGYNN